MWYTWTTLLLVSCTLVEGAEVQLERGTEAPASVATPRPPHRTLDRQAAQLAWNSWLQSPESGSQNAPPRRITTKSLFITPLICPKGQRLDGNGCVQAVTIGKDDNQRILLDEINKLFKVPSSGFGDYDYGDDEHGPLQLSIPIGSDPQAEPLQSDEPVGQAQQLQPNYIKKDETKPNNDASIEAELELLKLQNPNNKTAFPDGAGILDHNVLTNLHYAEKPKRDSPLNSTDLGSLNNTADEGQKELVFGQVNIDPVTYNAETHNLELAKIHTENSNISQQFNSNLTSANKSNNDNITLTNSPTTVKLNSDEKTLDSVTLPPKKEGEQSKINPENDYSDIGEAIKIISRYAEVTTDDNYSKNQKKENIDENVLGTRTKIQHRRNRPKLPETIPSQPETTENEKTFVHGNYPGNGVLYRYPRPSHSPTPPPDYPFRHIQDYWPDRTKVDGVYSIHGNPRRHHHSYTHNSRPHSPPYAGYLRLPDAYPQQLKGYIHRLAQHHGNQARSHKNQDLYSLLGLRHWFSSEGTAKR